MDENLAELLTTFNFRVILRQSELIQAGGSDTAVTTAARTLSSPGQQLGAGGFQECTGLEIEMETADVQEGGRNDGVIRRVGRGRYPAIVLKRGMFVVSPDDKPNPDGKADLQIWSWIAGVLSGVRPVIRYDGVIEVLDSQGEARDRVLATWSFARGLPLKVVGPTLNAKSGEIAIEELHIAHEGLRLEF